MARFDYTVVQGRLIDPNPTTNAQLHLPTQLPEPAFWITKLLMYSVSRLTLGTTFRADFQPVFSAVLHVLREEAGQNRDARPLERARSSQTAASTTGVSHSIDPVVKMKQMALLQFASVITALAPVDG
ncbi:hypothetical protein FRC00_001501 [Tulasnella sp. 408]|nr:hypothetical protein FRC00_001501 [Tulasnella sp. 408]